jgi:hypothetical protein
VGVVSDNSLPDPIGSYTSVFLEQTIPYMTATILSLSIANPADYDTALPFLDSVLMLGIWAATNDKVPLFHLLPSVLSTGNNSYKPRPPLTGDVHERVLNSFVENRYFDTLLERLREPDPIAAFGIFYNVLLLVPMDRRYDPLHGVFLETDPLLGRALREAMETQTPRSVDHQLAQAADLFFAFLFRIDSNVDVDLSEFFAFAEFCLRSEIVEKEVIGMQLIHDAARSRHFPTMNGIAKFANDHGLIEFLIGRPLHVEVVQRSCELFDLVSDKGFLKDGQLDKLWANACQQHTTERRPMFELVARAISALPPDRASTFSEGCMGLLQNVEFFPVLLSFLSRNGSHPELSLKVAEFVCRFPPALTEVPSNQYSLQIRDFFRRKIQEFISNGWEDLADTAGFVATFSNDETIPAIIKLIDTHCKLGFDVLGSIIRQSDGHTFTLSEVSQMYSSSHGNDDFFNLVCSACGPQKVL